MPSTLFYNDLPIDLMLHGDIAIDTETMGLNLHRDRLCVLQLSSGDGNAYLVKFVDNNYSAPNLKKLLLDKSRQKIFHFARFDLAAIQKYMGITLENIFCTKISSKLVRTYTDYHGLKDLCRELLGVQISKQQQSSDWGGEILSGDQIDYAGSDVLHLHALRNIFIERLKRENRLEMAKKIFEFIPMRSELDLSGWNEIDIFAH